jgi:hypothetical protein
MNDELGTIWEAGVVVYLRYYSASCLKLRTDGCSAKIRIKHVPNTHAFYHISKKNEYMETYPILYHWSLIPHSDL